MGLRMNGRRGGSFFIKRKPGLHIASDRMNPHHPINRPHNPHFTREMNTGYSTGSHHVQQKPRGRGFTGAPSFRPANFRENFNRYAPKPRGNVPPKPNQTLLRPNPSSTSSSSRLSHGNDQPVTFVCEGIEVNFDSSDSEEEVRPWKVAKVLKKNGGKIENALQVGSLKDEDNIKKKVIPCAQGNKILGEHDTLDKYQSDDEVQVLSPAPSDPMIVPEPAKRPSFVILSGLGKRTVSNTFRPINNCAIIKRPRFLFSQQVPRHPIEPSPKPRFSLPTPCFQEKPRSQPSAVDKNVDITLEESRIIDDVLDMTEEVEMRARFLNYRYS